MAKYCEICGKGVMSGNNVSHSKRRTRRTFKVNVQKVAFVQDGKEQKGYVCARCLKKAERAAFPPLHRAIVYPVRRLMFRKTKKV